MACFTQFENMPLSLFLNLRRHVSSLFDALKSNYPLRELTVSRRVLALAPGDNLQATIRQRPLQLQRLGRVSI